LVLGLLLAATPFFRGTMVARRRARLAWLLLLGSIWLVLAVSLGLNAGGGTYYFTPFYLTAAFYLMRCWSVDWWRRQSVVMATAVAALAVPWTTVWTQASQLHAAMPAARQFLSDLEKVTAGGVVVSEDLHLFKRAYSGEVVDMGDLVYQVQDTSRYFGDEFRQTARTYFEHLGANPPEFILAAGGTRLTSPVLGRYIDQPYEVVMRAPAHFWANPVGGGAVLMRRPGRPAAD
jgi:hypothetical protein